MNRNLSTFIDLSRWVAAFLVVLGHAAHFLIADISSVAHPTIVHHVVYFLTGLGHCAVMVFFVISGYLVGGITFNRWKSSGPDIPDYAISRFSRIYTVLVPALTLGYLLDSIGLRWIDGAGLYSNLGQYPIGSLDAVDVRLSPLVYVGNLLMLQGAYVTSLGSNGPLWSLAYEWWYYCIFCLLAASFLYRGWTWAAAVIGMALSIFFLPLGLLLWGAMWLLGMVTFFVCRTSIYKPHPALSAALFFGALVLLHSSGAFTGPLSRGVAFARDFGIALVYCVVLVSFSRNTVGVPFERLHRWAAGFSYSIYLVHFPIMLLLVALANAHFGWRVVDQPSYPAALKVSMLVLAVYVLGYLFYLLTEKHTDHVRVFLKRQMARLPIRQRVTSPAR